MMNQRADAGNRPASTIDAAFSHAEAFDFIDLRIAFDGTVFSSSPISANTYDGPWEDIPCEHADFVVRTSATEFFESLCKSIRSMTLRQLR